MASIDQLPTGKYRVRWYGVDGRRAQTVVTGKREANRLAQSVETDKARGVGHNPSDGHAPVSHFVESYLGRPMRPATVARDTSYLRCHLLPALGRRPVGKVTREEVQAWVHGLTEKGLSAATVQKHYRLLGAVFQEALDARAIPETPCRRIHLPRREAAEKRFLTHAEVRSLAEAIGPYYAPLVYTAAYAGLRWSECAGLKRESLALDRGMLTVCGAIERVGGTYRWVPTTKTAQGMRTLPLPAPLATLLQTHLESAPSSVYVFPAREGGHLRYDNFRTRAWPKATAKAGLDGLTFHELRHTCAALLIRHGADVLFVSRYLGHTDVRTTLNVYGHLFPRHGDQAVEAVGRGMLPSAPTSELPA
ncbi:MAG: tyrosine-type recombinase/integrase [Actinomycetota bacterium]